MICLSKKIAKSISITSHVAVTALVVVEDSRLGFLLKGVFELKQVGELPNGSENDFKL